MKTNRSILFVSLAAVALLIASATATRAQSSYTGTVMASQLASTGGSAGLAQWEKKLNCHGEADCSRQLVRAGGKYVLMTSKGAYELSDQSKAAQYVAQKVTVTGSVDGGKKSIEVADVQLSKGTASAGVP